MTLSSSSLRFKYDTACFISLFSSSVSAFFQDDFVFSGIILFAVIELFS